LRFGSANDTATSCATQDVRCKQLRCKTRCGSDFAPSIFFYFLFCIEHARSLCSNATCSGGLLCYSVLGKLDHYAVMIRAVAVCYVILYWACSITMQ
jgi:hypothetical protein